MQPKVDMQSNIGEGDQERAQDMSHFWPSKFFFFLLLPSRIREKKIISHINIKLLALFTRSFLSKMISHIHIGPLLAWLLAPFFEKFISHFHLQLVVTRFLNYKRIYFSYTINYRSLSSTRLIFKYCFCCTVILFRGVQLTASKGDR